MRLIVKAFEMVSRRDIKNFKSVANMVNDAWIQALGEVVLDDQMADQILQNSVRNQERMVKEYSVLANSLAERAIELFTKTEFDPDKVGTLLKDYAAFKDLYA